MAIDDKKPLRDFLVLVAGTVTGLVIVGALGAGAGALLTEAKLEVRVEQIEKDRAATATIPERLAGLTEKVDGMQRSLERLTAQLEGKTAAHR